MRILTNATCCPLNYSSVYPVVCLPSTSVSYDTFLCITKGAACTGADIGVLLEKTPVTLT